MSIPGHFQCLIKGGKLCLGQFMEYFLGILLRGTILDNGGRVGRCVFPMFRLVERVPVAGYGPFGGHAIGVSESPDLGLLRPLWAAA